MSDHGHIAASWSHIHDKVVPGPGTLDSLDHEVIIYILMYKQAGCCCAELTAIQEGSLMRSLYCLHNLGQTDCGADATQA